MRWVAMGMAIAETSHLSRTDNCCRLGNTGTELSYQAMPQEQLDAVKDQLLSEDNADLRQKVFGAYLEEPERGANMIIAFATDKGLKLDATPGEVVDYMEALDEEEIDIEMTPGMLGSVSGGKAIREDAPKWF